MKYTVIISKSVRKQFDKLPTDVKPRVLSKIQSLADIPRPDGVSKLKGFDSQYRIRVGSYRVRYEVSDEKLTIKLLKCRHRRDVYKDKE